jgi:hypothetical protein
LASIRPAAPAQKNSNPLHMVRTQSVRPLNSFSSFVIHAQGRVLSSHNLNGPPRSTFTTKISTVPAAQNRRFVVLHRWRHAKFAHPSLSATATLWRSILRPAQSIALSLLSCQTTQRFLSICCLII